MNDLALATKDQLEQMDETLEQAMVSLAREKTRNAVLEISALIYPGMSEKEAIKRANLYLADHGVRKFWHRTHVRMGKSTVLSFKDDYAEEQVLQEDDVFFVDIGPIWDGIEGDCGDTFVVGSNRDHLKIQKDVRTTFVEVRDYWNSTAASGVQLYQYAKARVEKLGYLLHPSYVKGHRLSEFSHSKYTKESIGNLDFHPSANRWVLEFQVCHPSMLYGAFFEDLLM